MHLHEVYQPAICQKSSCRCNKFGILWLLFASKKGIWGRYVCNPHRKFWPKTIGLTLTFLRAWTTELQSLLQSGSIVFHVLVKMNIIETPLP